MRADVPAVAIRIEMCGRRLLHPAEAYINGKATTPTRRAGIGAKVSGARPGRWPDQ
jgi:hypothetical protein